MRKLLVLAVTVFLAGVTWLPAQAQQRAKAEARPPAAAPGARLEYKLGVGDDIRVSVFQNPDLTLETRVGEDGHVTYPLIGRVRLDGLTVAAAERTIARALEKGGFLRRPQVNISPLEMRSTQVSVLGLVRKPGRFVVETVQTRVSEMLAMAGGIDATGADIAILTGQREGKAYRKEVNIPSLFVGKKLDDDVLVSGGDVIYVQRAPVFYIHGEVQSPGSYKVERDMTVRQALAQGGGLTPRGTERRLKLHRREADGNLKVMRPGLDDRIQPDDVLQVRESFF